MSKQMLRDFPRQYKNKAEILILEVTAQLRQCMLTVVSNAELRMQGREFFRKPDDLLKLAVEGFAEQLYNHLKNDRDAIDTVADLLDELGIEKGSDT